MLTEHNVDTLVEIFFSLLEIEEPTATQEAELNAVIQILGFTPEDLVNLAADCRRRAIYLNNT